MEKLKTEYTIERSRWARQTDGVNKGSSSLENAAGNMCCLGFVAKANGYATKRLGSDGEIVPKGSPAWGEEERPVDGAVWPTDGVQRKRRISPISLPSTA